MPSVDVGSRIGYYSIPTLALSRICYFVFSLLMTCTQRTRVIIQAISSVTRVETRWRGRRSARARHYILDLRPNSRKRHGTDPKVKRHGSRGHFVRGGYFIPTIALANISQLLMTTLTEFSSYCVDSGVRVVLTTVLGIAQLQGRQPDGEVLIDNVQNHYIFDLRPQYGTDITEILRNVLENNWPTNLVPYFRKHRKRSKRKFIFMSGWRPKLVNIESKKRTKKQDLRQSNEQFGEYKSSGNVFQLEEALVLELPVQDTDDDTDVQFPISTRQTYIPVT